MSWRELKIIGSLIIITFFEFGLHANHFETVWEGENGFGHMNIFFVSALLDNKDLEIGDEIGVFNENICVGKGKIETVIDSGNANTFLHVVLSMNDGTGNGFTNKDSINFRIWDQSSQSELSIHEVEFKDWSTSWNTSGLFESGSSAFAEIICKTSIHQKIDLKFGWNLFSSNLVPLENGIDQILQNLISQGIRIKVTDEAGQLFEDWGFQNGFINQIGEFKSTEGYKICVSRSCQLEIEGHRVELPLTIGLRKGWNLVSFPLSDEVNANFVFEELISSGKLIKVQDETGQSLEYWSEEKGWINGIGSLYPGKGYWVKLNEAGELNFSTNNFKGQSMSTSYSNQEPIHFNSQILGNGVNHMNFNLILDGNINDGDEIAVFDRDICVGVTRVTETDFQNGYLSVVASGSSFSPSDGFKAGNNYTLKLWKSHENKEQTLDPIELIGAAEFVNNGTVLIKLDIANKLASDLHLRNADIKLFPNPAKTFVTVEFNKLTSFPVTFEIINTSGRILETKEIGINHTYLDVQHLAEGIYILKFSNSQYKTVERLIIK